MIATERYNASRIVERQVEAGRGDKAAFIAADGTLTYDELRRRISRFGGLLQQIGVRQEDRVLLVLDDTTVFPSAFLGALHVGAVPVPVSAMDKADNYRHYVADSYARVVVTDAGKLADLQEALSAEDLIYVVSGGSGPGVIELDAALAAQDETLAAVATHRDDMAFWLYSSGSTGKPKGVVHLHHDIAVTCENYAGQVLGLRADDVTFSTTKLFHAYGLGNGLSFPLWFGATSVLMKGPSKPGSILATLEAHRPTVFFSVPGLYALLVRDPRADGTMEGVRLCVSAAEPLPPMTFERWRERFGLDIIDGIGSTELLHIYCSNRPGAVAPGTSGWPVPGYDLRLVDEEGHVLEGPAVGNLEVRGDSCASFYWHQHEKTKSCMQGEWFRSGDRYERRDDGSYLYVGRMDDMLKIGGLWVSPIDMEHALLEHPRVRGVGVIGVQIDERSRIAAYIECDGAGDAALAEELREWCKARLRRYEYPQIVEFVDALPRTLTGKVQRFKLREAAERRAAE
jgi:benzoate-CoA ligase family protein